MYGYQDFIELSPEQILQKVTQEQIFEWVLQENFLWEARYKSPFREHSKDKGTCRFEEREDGTILFVDFGERFLTGETHRTCWRMVMRKHGCDLEGAIKRVCDHFGLSNNPDDYKPVIYSEYKKGEGDSSDRRASINYIAKPFVKSDILF